MLLVEKLKHFISKSSELRYQIYTCVLLLVDMFLFCLLGDLTSYLDDLNTAKFVINATYSLKLVSIYKLMSHSDLTGS